MSQLVPLEQNRRMCRLRTHDAHVIRLSTDQNVDPVDITMETARALPEGKRATSVRWTEESLSIKAPLNQPKGKQCRRST